MDASRIATVLTNFTTSNQIYGLSQYQSVLQARVQLQGVADTRGEGKGLAFTFNST